MHMLCMTDVQRAEIESILFDSHDEKEHIVFAICGRRVGEHSTKLIVHQIFAPPEGCIASNSPTHVRWRTAGLDDVLSLAIKKKLAIVKIHSHPPDANGFSPADDDSDKALFSSIHSLLEDHLPHASVVFTANGFVFGRFIYPDLSMLPIDRISVIGPYIHFSDIEDDDFVVPEHSIRHGLIFGSRTIQVLKHLSVAVVGCSGTGSVMVEQLARLGVGRIVLVDPDSIERKNLNRIINATGKDADVKRLKVDRLAEAIVSMDLGTEVITVPENICDSREAIMVVAECDVMFGCVDSQEGRVLMTELAAFYCVPYIDLGVFLDADKESPGQINHANYAVHYLQPGQSTLISRGSVSLEAAHAESLHRLHPEQYEALKEEKYISGAPVDEDTPAVICLNMATASMAAMEFLARIHPFRDRDIDMTLARVDMSFVNMDLYMRQEMGPGGVDVGFHRHLGRGDTEPLLGKPSLSKSR